MIQRAFEGETDSYPEPGSKPGARDVNQPIDSADLFGLDARIDGYLGDGDYRLRSSFSSFNPNHLPNALVSFWHLHTAFENAFLGNVQARAFSAYRYRVWNGSLGLQDIYSAFGGSIENRQDCLNLAGLQVSFISGVLRPATTRAMAFKTTNLTELGGPTAYGTVRLSWQIWEGETLAVDA